MRIDELTRPNHRFSAGDILKKAGYEQIGDGSYADIWHREGEPFVLKLFCASDVAYIAYMSLASRHQDNPHFPKFRGKPVKVGPTYYAVRVEKLAPYKGDSGLLQYYVKWRDHKFENPNDYYAMKMDDALEWMEYNPEFKEACDLILDNLIKKGFEQDFEDRNFMARGSTIVITDPVKNTHSSPHYWDDGSFEIRESFGKVWDFNPQIEIESYSRNGERLDEKVVTTNKERIVAHMIDSLLQGVYWDVNKPHDMTDAHDMAYEWHHDGDIPSDDIDTPEFKERLTAWANARYDEIVEKINAIQTHDGGYHAHRVIKVTRGWLRKLVVGEAIPLGIYWTYDYQEWDASTGAYAVWAEKALLGPEIVIEAIIPETSVDWDGTIMANMDWMSGDRECELRLTKGAPVKVMSITNKETEKPYKFGNAKFIA